MASAVSREISWNESSIQQELEVLEAIYINELEVEYGESDVPTCIMITLHPATGDNPDEQYVCLTLVFNLPQDYPEVAPEISIKNPRGLACEEIERISSFLQETSKERQGMPMLYELIELAKEGLTAGNIPHGDCVICMQCFQEGEEFTKTECYHYFHCHCLARHIKHSLQVIEQELEEAKIKAPHVEHEAKQVACPVCREPMTYNLDALGQAAPPISGSDQFEPDAKFKAWQAEMKSLLAKQKEKGAVIDVDEEKKKYLVKAGTVVSSECLKPQNASNTSSTAKSKKEVPDGMDKLAKADGKLDILDKGRGHVKSADDKVRSRRSGRPDSSKSAHKIEEHAGGGKNRTEQKYRPYGSQKPMKYEYTKDEHRSDHRGSHWRDKNNEDSRDEHGKDERRGYRHGDKHEHWKIDRHGHGTEYRERRDEGNEYNRHKRGEENEHRHKKDNWNEHRHRSDEGYKRYMGNEHRHRRDEGHQRDMGNEHRHRLDEGNEHRNKRDENEHKCRGDDRNEQRTDERPKPRTYESHGRYEKNERRKFRSKDEDGYRNDHSTYQRSKQPSSARDENRSLQSERSRDSGKRYSDGHRINRDERKQQSTENTIDNDELKRDNDDKSNQNAVELQNQMDEKRESVGGRKGNKENENDHSKGRPGSGHYRNRHHHDRYFSDHQRSHVRLASDRHVKKAVNDRRVHESAKHHYQTGNHEAENETKIKTKLSESKQSGIENGAANLVSIDKSTEHPPGFDAPTKANIADSKDSGTSIKPPSAESKNTSSSINPPPGFSVKKEISHPPGFVIKPPPGFGHK